MGCASSKSPPSKDPIKNESIPAASNKEHANLADECQDAIEDQPISPSLIDVNTQIDSREHSQSFYSEDDESEDEESGAFEELEDGNLKMVLQIHQTNNLYQRHGVDSINRVLKREEYFVKMCVKSSVDETLRRGNILKTVTAVQSNGSARFGSIMSLDNLLEDDLIEFVLCSSTLGVDSEIGRTLISVKDLAKKSEYDLWLFHGSLSLAVFDRNAENPTTLHITDIEIGNSGTLFNEKGDVVLKRVVSRTIEINELPRLKEELKASPSRRLSNLSELHLDTVHEEDEKRSKVFYVITQGTRGDVQPWIALARGLATLYGWTVYICTQMRYKGLVQSFSQVKRGALKFRPSGGDTERRIQAPIPRRAVNSKSSVLQAMMLARTEREFFKQEPEMYYWAKHIKPDYVGYSFVTANIGIIISESLKIPCIGFILQPTVIPSKFYQPIASLTQTEVDREVKLSGFESHSTLKRIKRLWENNIFSSRLDLMRTRRGLMKINRKLNDFEIIQLQHLPFVVPIKPELFGGRPADWSNQSLLTEFIFLRGDDVPSVPADMMRFIQGARERGEKVIAVCFSSMPLTRKQILKSALRMVHHCAAPYKVSLIALEGNRPTTEVTSTYLEKDAAQLISDGRLHLAKGAPFSRLFPLMDFVVIHGGLGTTAECFASGVPCMVTGVLLMDQRFWGIRVFELGVGPKPVHISDFNHEILEILPKALDENGSWAQRAKEIKAKLFSGGELGDGVAENSKAIVELCAVASPADLSSYQR